MNLQKQRPPSSGPHIALFFVISLCVIAAGILYYFNQKKTILGEKQQELSAISNLKIRQITQWRLDRLGNAKFLSDNTLLIKRIAKYIQNPKTNSLENNVLQSLKSLTENFDYKNVLLLDPKGKVSLSYPDKDTLLGDFLKPLLPGIINGRKIVLTDLHKTDKVSYVHLDLIIPLIDRTKNDTLVIGIIALRIDPQQFLYPLIKSWPAKSKSSESMIIRRDGDEIVYLNELKYIKNNDLLFRKSVNTSKLVSAMALKGFNETADALDYRGVRVVADMKKIPGTPWYMIAKIDRDEILSDLNKQSVMGLIILFLSIITAGLFLGFLLRNQRVNYYREKYESELDRLALIKHFDYILKFANDVIFLIDSNLEIVEANDRALEIYKYTRKEIIGMSLEKLRAPEALANLKEQLNLVDANEAGTFETIHIRKDGSVFPIEISSRVVNIEGAKYYQTIGRDITERKLASDALKESEEKFRKIFEESPFSMVMTGKDLGIVRANLAFCKMTGYDESELKSLSFRDFTHPDYLPVDDLSLYETYSRRN